METEKIEGLEPEILEVEQVEKDHMEKISFLCKQMDERLNLPECFNLTNYHNKNIPVVSKGVIVRDWKEGWQHNIDYAIKKREALAKLTDEEKTILGLA